MKHPVISLANMNPFSSFFAKSRGDNYESVQKQKAENSQAVAPEDNILATLDNAMTSYGSVGNQPLNGSSVIVTGVQFQQVFSNKKQKVAKYREMSNYPVVSEALDHACDEAIVENNDGKIVELDILRELPKSVENKVRYEWQRLVNDVMEVQDTAWKDFRRFMVDSEIYSEKILNRSGTKILAVKNVPCYTMTPVYRGTVLTGFMQVPENIGNLKSEEISFDADQIIYQAYDFGYNILDVRGYLDPSIKLYNQLKALEDTLVVGRLSRAPDRRVWNVDVGKMPKPRAEEYMKGLIQRFKKKFTYDPATGIVNVAQNVIAVTEDYWFAKTADGGGTSVEFINGSNNLGDLDDVMYILKQLYRTLKLPKGRWQDDSSSTFPDGKMGEITQDEVHYARFTNRNQGKFKFYYKDPFITQLKLCGLEAKYCNPKLYNVRFTNNNLFKEYKELEIVSTKMDILNGMSNLLWSKENDSGLFHPEFVLRKYFKMSDADFDENNTMIKKDRGAPEITSTPEELTGEDALGPEQLESELNNPPQSEEKPEGAGGEEPPRIGEEAKAESIEHKNFSLFNECKKALIKIEHKHNAV